MIDNNKFQKSNSEKSADIRGIKSNYILSNISNFLPKAKENNWLDIIKYNKELLKRTDVSVFLKKRCWLDYREKILTDNIFACERSNLIYEVVESVFDEGINQMENDLKDKQKEEQEQFHYDTTTGEIDETFKLVLKAYCLQDILFDLFSIDENDIMKLDFIENGLGDLNLNSADLLNKVITGVLTSKEKQNARLNKLNEIITQPDKKITLKTFDEHNAQNKNFAPEEKRNLWYQMSLKQCLEKVKTNIDAEEANLNNSIDAAQNELNEIEQQKQNLLNKLIANGKIINGIAAENTNFEVQLKKLCKCKNLLSNDPGYLPFRTKFIKNQSGEGPYKTEYDIEIKYDEIHTKENIELVNQVLSDINQTGNTITQEDSPAHKKKLLSNLINHKNDLDFRRALLLEQLIDDKCIGLDRCIEYDLSKYDEHISNQIREIINLALDSYITDFKICMVRNSIKRLETVQNVQVIKNQLGDFKARNNARISELNKLIQTNKAKEELLANIWTSFNQDNSNEFNPVNPDEFGLVNSDLNSKVGYLLMLNAVYFSDSKISDLYEYICQYCGETFDIECGLVAYCKDIRDRYYYTGTQEEKKLIINRLCFIIMKYKNEDEAIKVCENLFFPNDDIREIEQCRGGIFIFLKKILWNLVMFALTSAPFYMLVLFQLIKFNWIFFLILNFINAIGVLIGIGGVVYNLFKYLSQISKYLSHKNELATRKKNFYDFDYEAERKKVDDSKKDIDKQEQLLGVYMKYGNKVPAQVKNTQTVNNLDENNNIL